MSRMIVSRWVSVIRSVEQIGAQARQLLTCVRRANGKRFMTPFPEILYAV